MFRPALVLFAAIVIFSPASQLSAATYLVLPDASGDFPTIQAAIDAARDGDVIRLGYGRFRGDGNRDLHYDGKAITIRSQSGHPETCIIDCEGGSTNITRGFLFDGEGPGSVLQDVTIENGFVDDAGLPFNDCSGGAAIFLNGASPTFTNVTIRHCGAFAAGGVMILSGSPRFTGCRFIDNASCGGGGGYCFEGSPEFIECLFEDNAPLQSGGGFTINGAELATFTDCIFRNNCCLHCGWGGGLGLARTTAVITGCTFIGNRTYGSGDGRGARNCTGWDLDGGGSRDCEGGAIGVSDAHVIINRCTIVGNVAPSGGGIGIDVWASDASIVEITNTIIAFNLEGGAFTCSLPYDQVSIHCTDIYGNIGGDWTGCIAGLEDLHHNLSEDPLFCDLEAGDLTIDSGSPCATENSGGCWLIGAWPVGCGAAGVPGEFGTDRSLATLRIVPNPVVGECRVEVCPGTGGVHEGRVGTTRGSGWRAEVTAQVLDVAGRVVRDLSLRPSSSPEGCQEARWDTRDNQGQRVPSGIYLVRVGTEGGAVSTRLVVHS